MRVDCPLSQLGYRPMFTSRQRTGCGRKTHMDVMPRITNENKKSRVQYETGFGSFAVRHRGTFIPSYHGTRLAEMGCAFTRIYA